MTPERWQQIQDVLEKALALAPGERSHLLNEACASDPLLRQEVATFLACGDRLRSSFLELPPSRLPLAAGIKVGEYEVKFMLGAGSMGEVYRARDAHLGRDVAIKVLPVLLSADPDRLRRFENEARATAALNHPNILAVFQMGTFEGAPYLVSELLEGETLREEVKRGRRSVRKAIDYGMQIASGLAAAHEKGIVHRDLKPENLFVTKDGRVKILDFGLAKVTQIPSSSDPGAPVTEKTEAGVVMGTVGYMAPEQVRGQTADHRADIFAFGAILYEMLTGKRAFQKPTSPETMTAILNEDPQGISQLAADTPPALQRVVHRCLEKNAEQRFQSASDLAFALDTFSEWERSGDTGDTPRSIAPGDIPARNTPPAIAGSRRETGADAHWPWKSSPKKSWPKKFKWIAASLVALLLVSVNVWTRRALGTSTSDPAVQSLQATLSLTVDQTDGKLLTYYRATDSNLYQLVWPWDPNQSSQITGAHGRPAADEGSGIASYVNPISHGPEIFYLAQGSQHVEHISILGLLPTDLNLATGAPAAARGSDLAGFIDECTQTDNLFYVGVDQHVHLLTWTLAQGWTTQDLTSLTNSAPVAGTRIAGHIVAKSVAAFYFAPDHHLHELWRWPECGSSHFDGWHSVDVNKSSEGTVADATESSPLTGFFTETKGDAEFYVDSHQHLQELFFNGKWTNIDVTAVSGSPKIGARAISAHLNSITHSESIYFVNSEGNIREVTAPAETPTQWRAELASPLNVLAGRCSGTERGPAPVAASQSPLISGVNSMWYGAEEIFYLGEDQQMYQVELGRDGWSCANITKSSGTPGPAR